MEILAVSDATVMLFHVSCYTALDSLCCQWLYLWAVLALCDC